MDEKKLYPMMKAVIREMQKYLPPDFHGNIKWDLYFRDGEIYKALDVNLERSLDVEKLK